MYKRSRTAMPSLSTDPCDAETKAAITDGRFSSLGDKLSVYHMIDVTVTSSNKRENQI